MKTWKDLKKELTSISDIEQQTIKVMAHLVNEISRYRRSINMTQQEVADRAGITQAQVARLENSHTIPKWDTIMKVVIALGLKMKLEIKD